jgi:MraZ protein
LAFRGAFDYTLDAKNRLTVPAKFRAALAGGVVLAKGVDPCVAIWRAEDYERFVAGAVEGSNPLSPQRRQIERFFSANGFDAELDGAGRVGIPAKLAAHAGLAKDVVVTGAGSCIEVWDRSRWEAYDSELTTDIPDIAASLGHPA